MTKKQKIGHDINTEFIFTGIVILLAKSANDEEIDVLVMKRICCMFDVKLNGKKT